MFSNPALSIKEIFSILQSDIDLLLYILPESQEISCFSPYLYLIQICCFSYKFEADEEKVIEVQYEKEKMKIIALQFLSNFEYPINKNDNEAMTFFDGLGLK